MSIRTLTKPERLLRRYFGNELNSILDKDSNPDGVSKLILRTIYFYIKNKKEAHPPASLDAAEYEEMHRQVADDIRKNEQDRINGKISDDETLVSAIIANVLIPNFLSRKVD